MKGATAGGTRRGKRYMCWIRVKRHHCIREESPIRGEACMAQRLLTPQPFVSGKQLPYDSSQGGRTTRAVGHEQAVFCFSKQDVYASSKNQLDGKKVERFEWYLQVVAMLEKKVGEDAFRKIIQRLLSNACENSGKGEKHLAHFDS